VFEIHEQHFWQLVDGLVIASMHVRVDSTVAWSQVRSSITGVLHQNGVHNMTLQPEFLSVGGVVGR
jgi:zinc transporter 1